MILEHEIHNILSNYYETLVISIEVRFPSHLLNKKLNIFLKEIRPEVL
jgi:hypothetical protein